MQTIPAKYTIRSYLEQTDCSSELHYDLYISVMMKLFYFIVFVCEMKIIFLEEYRSQVIWEILSDNGDEVC
jgi:hypothetical protein